MNSIIKIFTLLVLFVACNESEPQYIDQSVSGIKIGDSESSLAVLAKEIQDKRVFLKPLLVASADESEILELYLHPGSNHYSYNEFKLRYLNNKQKFDAKMQELNQFVSEKGIRLGMSLKDFNKLMGEQWEVVEDLEVKTLSTKLVGMEKSQFLKKQNMPIYFGEYKFKNNKLIEAHWGLEYP